MEAICDQDNIEAALDAVVRNKGAPGIDGITVKQLPSILKARWPEIEDQLLHGRYQPQPVRRVQIPKPTGGMRNLGIPTTIDRVLQQAVLQRLQPGWDPTFSEHSYGFRPSRSAHQAVAPLRANDDETNTCREFTLGGIGQTSSGYAPNQRQQDSCSSRR
jgi:RNA-directed DNA polymerase